MLWDKMVDLEIKMFQYAALVGISKNMGYDYCIPDHSNVTWFDKMVGDQIVTQHHQLQHLFENE